MSTSGGTYSVYRGMKGWKMPFTILTALEAYRLKYDEPTVLLLNPADIPERPIPGIEVVPVSFVPRGTVYVGVREEER